MIIIVYLIIEGVEMLGMCISFDTDDAAIFNSFLSFLSATFGFVDFAPEHLRPALNKVRPVNGLIEEFCFRN